MSSPDDSIRLDRWLWFARFFKTRSLSARIVSAGKVRLNAARTDKASVLVRVGDTLTFPQADDIRVVRVLAVGTRRGPAAEAHSIFEDLSPPEPKKKPTAKLPTDQGRGRPTKKDRRALDRFLNSTDDG